MLMPSLMRLLANFLHNKNKSPAFFQYFNGIHVAEMTERYNRFAEIGVKDISSYNKKLKH